MSEIGAIGQRLDNNDMYENVNEYDAFDCPVFRVEINVLQHLTL